MTNVLTRDADALHRALDGAGDEIKVSISRETAEWLARIVDARSRGQRIVVTHGRAEVTPAEAAASRAPRFASSWTRASWAFAWSVRTTAFRWSRSRRSVSGSDSR